MLYILFTYIMHCFDILNISTYVCVNIYVYIYKINNTINYPMILNSLSPGFHTFEKASLD